GVARRTRPSRRARAVAVPAVVPGLGRYGGCPPGRVARRADGDALRADGSAVDGAPGQGCAHALPRCAMLAVLSARMSDRPCLPARHRPRERCLEREGGRRDMSTVLHTESSPGLGGQEIRTLHEARWTAARGWRVILACRPDGLLLERARHMGIEAVALPMKKPWDVRAMARLLGLIRRERVSIVHTHSSVDAWLAGVAARAGRVPVVRTRHVSIAIRRGFNPVYT